MRSCRGLIAHSRFLSNVSFLILILRVFFICRLLDKKRYVLFKFSKRRDLFKKNVSIECIPSFVSFLISRLLY